jgi:alanine racemase
VLHTPTLVQISLPHLRHNVRWLQQRLGPATLMAVVKADAYGHGLVPIARTLQGVGVRHFAVARVAEALMLREAGLEASILVLGVVFPEDLPVCVAQQLDVAVSSLATAEAVCTAAQRWGTLRVHVKVDTGMGRLGLWPDEAPQLVRRLAQTSRIQLGGLWTHLSTADDPQDTFMYQQLERFEQLCRQLGDDFETIHVANSSALIRLPQTYWYSPRQQARVGAALYGYTSHPELLRQADLRPVMRMVSRVVQVRTVPPGTTISYGRTWTAPDWRRIAVVGAGYGDGIPRRLSNRGRVGIRGQQFPIVGTVCMDLLMVDLGSPDAACDVQEGEEAVLFGEGGPSILEVAAWADTIPYELSCGVARRVPRCYQEMLPSPEYCVENI